MQKKMVFTLTDDDGNHVSGRVVAENNGLCIYVGGCGNHVMQDGHGQVMALDLWDGKLSALLWPDFNEEEVTSISLEGAREPKEGDGAKG